MSSVSTTSDSGTLNFYRNQLNEIEDRFKEQKKRNDIANETRLKEIEENYKNTIRKQEKENEESLDKVKKNASETIQLEKNNSKNEIERVKSQMYDRYGRYTGLESEELKEQLQQLKEHSKENEENYQQKIKNLEETHSKKINDIVKQTPEIIERAVNEAKTASRESFHDAFERQNTEYDHYKKDIENRSKILQDENEKQLRTYLDHVDSTLKDYAGGYSHRERQLENAQRVHDEKILNSQEELRQKDAKNLEKAHTEETRAIRDRMKEVTTTGLKAEKDKANSTQQLLKETEAGYLNRQRTLTEGFQEQINKLKDQNEQVQNYLADQSEQHIRSKDMYFTDVVADLNREHHSAQKELEREYTEERKQSDIKAKNNTLLTERRMENLTKNLLDQKEKALQSQSRAYNDTIENIRQNNQDKIRVLQHEISSKKYSTDDTFKSAAATEDQIQKALTKEYSKALDVERERNKKTTDSIQQEYGERLNAISQERLNRETNLVKQGVAEHNIERSQFLSHMQDTQTMHEEVMRNKEKEAERQMNNVIRKYGNAITQQRREFEGLLQDVKNDAAIKVAAVREESDFNTRMALRDFAVRHHEMVRDYEKKLAEQKAEFEDKIENIKSQHVVTLRESEKNSKQMLDDQIRNYEQRIAQMEAQFKERERYLQQTYDEQVEKMRRNNALILQKKS